MHSHGCDSNTHFRPWTPLGGNLYVCSVRSNFIFIFVVFEVVEYGKRLHSAGTSFKQSLGQRMSLGEADRGCWLNDLFWSGLPATGYIWRLRGILSTCFLALVVSWGEEDSPIDTPPESSSVRNVSHLP